MAAAERLTQLPQLPLLPLLPLVPPSPEELHPALWRAHQLGRPQQAVTSSGFGALDAELPGGGWPARVLTELWLPHPGIGELRLLAPVLASLQQQQRCAMWFDPPAQPCAWALLALGIDVRQLVVVHAKHALKAPARALLPAADILWGLEQALKSGHLGVIVAWLPARLPADAVRRLQLAAQAHDAPVFLLRDAPRQLRHANANAAVQLPPSAAPLRLLLSSAEPDVLRLRILKRRGPPLATPLLLDLPAVLSAPARERARAPAAPAHASAEWPLQAPARSVEALSPLPLAREG